jgi:hypothetical protein
MAKAKKDSLQQLTKVFRKLGAKDPEGWARSQIEEGIPQLARYVFLRQAWTYVADEKDDSWIDELLKLPVSQLARPALKRMLKKGVDRKDIVDLVREMQYNLLFDILYQLDGAYGCGVDFLDETMPFMSWHLFQTNEEGEPTVPIGGLYESVLRMDPTGREMGPRK